MNKQRLVVFVLTLLIIMSVSVVQAVSAEVQMEEEVEISADGRYDYDSTLNMANQSDQKYSNYNMTWQPFKEEYDIGGVVSCTPHPPHKTSINFTGLDENEWLHVTTPVRFTYEQVMQGTSHSWWRSPFAVDEDDYEFRLRIYRISQKSGIDLTSDDDDIDVGMRTYPTKVYDSENINTSSPFIRHYNLTLPEEITDKEINYNFLYHEAMVPLYADEHYLPVFSIKNVKSPVEMYVNQNDVGGNEYNQSHIAWGSGSNTYTRNVGANVDIGILHQYGQSDYTAGVGLSGSFDDDFSEVDKIENTWDTNAEWDKGTHDNTESLNDDLMLEQESDTTTSTTLSIFNDNELKSTSSWSVSSQTEWESNTESFGNTKVEDSELQIGEEIVFQDNFNGQPDGSTPDGWTVVNSGDYFEIDTSKSAEGDACLIAKGENGDRAKGYKTFDSHAPDNIKWYARPGSEEYDESHKFRFIDSSDNILFDFNMWTPEDTDDLELRHNDDILIATTGRDEWYEIHITNIDWGSHTFDAEMFDSSGNSIGTETGVSFNYDGDSIAEVYTNNKGWGAPEMAYDDIRTNNNLESGTWQSIIWDIGATTQQQISSFKTTSTIGSNENIDARVGVDTDDDGTINEWSSWITLSGGTDEDISDQISISSGYRYQIEYELFVTDSDTSHTPTIDSYTLETENVNLAPYEPTNPQPPDGSTGISTDVTLSVVATDPEGDSLTVSFYDASDDSLIGQESGVVNDTATTDWTGLDYDTTYNWYAESDDGQKTNQSDTWSFTTEVNEVENIEVTTQPQLVYDSGDSLDLSGMKVTETYTDGSTNTVTFTDGTHTDYSTSPSHGSTLDESDDGTSVTVTHDSTSTSNTTDPLSINTVVDSIEVTTQPQLEYMSEETLDLSNMEITETYTDGTTEIVVHDDYDWKNNYTASPSDGYVLTGSDHGDKVQVTYNPESITTYSNQLIIKHELITDSTDNGYVSNPGEGTFVYEHSTTVSIEAVNSTGYEFTEWTGDVGSISDRYAKSTTIDMLSDYSITANFEIKTYILGITINGNGTVNKDPDQTEYEHGTDVTLTANSDDGHEFINWTGDYIGTDNPTTITMTENKSITANFERITYGEWYSQELSLDDIEYYQSSDIAYDEEGDLYNYIKVYVKLSSWSSWEFVNDGDDLPNVNIGDDLSSEDLQFKVEITRDDPDGVEPKLNNLYVYVEDKASVAMEWWVDFSSMSDQFGSNGYDNMTINFPFLYKNEDMVRINVQMDYYVDGTKLPFSATFPSNNYHQNYVLISREYKTVKDNVNDAGYTVSEIDDIRMRIYTNTSYDESELKFWAYDYNNNYSTSYRYAHTDIIRNDGTVQKIGYQIWHSVQLTKGKWERIEPKSSYNYEQLKEKRDDGIPWRTIIEHTALMTGGAAGIILSQYIWRNYGDTPPSKVMRSWAEEGTQMIIDGAMKVGNILYGIGLKLWEGIQWLASKIAYYGMALINLVILTFSLASYMIFIAVTIKVSLGLLILVQRGVDPMLEYYSCFMDEIIGLTQQAASMLPGV